MVNLNPSDPNIPMFVYYVDTSGLTRMKSREVILHISEVWKSASDYPIVILPAKETKFECVYGGKYHDKEDKLKDLVNFYEEEISKSNNPNSPQAQEIRDGLTNLQKTIKRFTNIRKLFK